MAMFRLPAALLLLSALLFAGQGGRTLSGRVIDRETGSPLPAYVLLQGTDIGCTADSEGCFELTPPDSLPGPPFPLKIYLIGYRIKSLSARPGQPLTIALRLEPMEAHEITVAADSVVSGKGTENTIAIDRMDVYALPGTAADPIYASQVLPGVNAPPDSSAILIRGGGPEETAYFFDGIEIDHPFLAESLHESYFSIFDNQIIEGFTVSNSGFHPRYGNALSGVLDITAKDGSSGKEGGLGLSIMGLNSYLALPLPGRGSIIGSLNSGRSELMSRINRISHSQFRTGNGFAKLRLPLDRNHTLRILGLFDSYGFDHEDGFAIDSQNLVSGISLTSSLGRALVSRVLVSRVSHTSGFDQDGAFHKDLEDTAGQIRWDMLADLKRHDLEFGLDLRSRSLRVEGAETGGEAFSAGSRGFRWGLYLNDRLRLSDRLFLTAGGRLSGLRSAGTRTAFAPGASFAYLLSRRDFLRLSVGRHHQFGDLFQLEDHPLLRPKRADHFSLSYDHITDRLETRITIFRKNYRRLPLEITEGVVDDSGHGYARGMEFFGRLRTGRLDALLVYNRLDSRRKQDRILQIAPSPYEIRHSLTTILSINLGDLSLGIRGSFASGRPFTPLLDRIWDPEALAFAPLWGEAYSDRLPAYQRIDLNGRKTISLGRKMAILYFGITNLLNRRNVLQYTYSDEYGDRTGRHSIFGRTIFLGFYLPFY